MPTLGELVSDALSDRFVNPAETYWMVPELRAAVTALKSLGFWDAEVLEGPLGVNVVDAPTLDGSNKATFVFVGPQELGRARPWGNNEGQRFRIIVLPVKEGEDG